MKTLLTDIKEEQEYDSTYDNEYDYLTERINYALNPGARGSTKAETPAVLHEMQRFLEKRLQAIRQKPVADEDVTGRLAAIQTKITALNNKFQRGVLTVPK